MVYPKPGADKPIQVADRGSTPARGKQLPQNPESQDGNDASQHKEDHVMSSSVAALRALVEQRFPDALPITHRTTAVATGLAALDHILPSGGLPRGRLSAWDSHGGATAILRATCLTTVRAGERAAFAERFLFDQPNPPSSSLQRSFLSASFDDRHNVDVDQTP